MISVGIDLGGTRIKLGILSSGKVIASKFLNTSPLHGLKGKLSILEKEIKKLLTEYRYNIQQCAALAFAFPGIVDSVNKKILSTNEKYDDAVNIDLNKWCRTSFNLPFIIENDANSALLGECFYGSAKGYNNVVLMILGTGIGTAAVINGKLLHGKHFQAGCLGGHLTVEVNGNKCTCGNYGCVEAEGGSLVVSRMVKNSPEFLESAFVGEKVIDFKTVVSLKKESDKLAGEIFNKLIDIWSAGLVNLIHAYDPEAIVLSGGIMNSSDEVFPPLKEKVLNNAWIPWGKPKFILAENPNLSVLLGLDYLTRNIAE